MEKPAFSPTINLTADLTESVSSKTSKVARDHSSPRSKTPDIHIKIFEVYFSSDRQQRMTYTVLANSDFNG